MWYPRVGKTVGRFGAEVAGMLLKSVWFLDSNIFIHILFYDMR